MAEFQSRAVASLVELHSVELRRFMDTWKRFQASGKPMPESPAQLQAQLRSARAELQSLRNQCEILKKTLAILSQPPSAAKE